MIFLEIKKSTFFICTLSLYKIRCRFKSAKLVLLLKLLSVKHPQIQLIHPQLSKMYTHQQNL